MPASRTKTPKNNHQDDNTVEAKRLTAPQIFDAAAENGRDELDRSDRKQAFSGVAGGLTIGLTALGVACVRALLPLETRHGLLPYLFYPIGFVAVIIGRAQLFTENTLYPVVLVLDERRHLLKTLRLWGVVFVSNICGALLFAVMAVKSSALQGDVISQLVQLGQEAAAGAAAHLFWSGVIGGWMIALVAWTVTASQWTIGQLAIIYLLTSVVGIGRFAHCVAGSCELLAAVLGGGLAVSDYFHWLIPVTFGNICGGVFIVSLLNYGQVKEL